MKRVALPYVVAVTVSAAFGFLFSAISTRDFIAHLDRQVHAITCSFIPGLSAPDIAGTSGCHVVMMSPYSSVFRRAMWGGIPIALPAMAVFAYLIWRGLDMIFRRVEGHRDETLFMVAATFLPLLTSLVYFGISNWIIGAFCKLCIGIYISSLAAFLAALAAYRVARAHAGDERPFEIPWATYGIYFFEGVVFVIVPVLLFLLLRPSYSVARGECGSLPQPKDKYGIRIPLHPNPSGVGALEILDPLCPACRAFDARLKAGGLLDRMNLEAVLYPMDNSCNWMVESTLHPGACAISEAVLCAGREGRAVIEWAFAHQNELLERGRQGDEAVYQAVSDAFPMVRGCVGRPEVETRLNRALRWAVANTIPVLTPQLYIENEKICDEDIDLGLEFVLSRELDAREKGGSP